MYRRTVLAAAPAALAGCGLAPSPPSTDGYPETPPNAFFEVDWDPDDDAYVVEFARGNRLTADNTGGLVVVVSPEEGSASSDCGSATRTPTQAAATSATPWPRSR
ncbi:hypothetical protein ACFQFH_09475 [Halobaculum halobium]|uniref:Uncharacterized protein n=1 Tax=Halobaculum halobium TaxID=3032281 RepID=A0ABD5TA33_9EURY|nr:hypothetical protein [Halobaculum sp. SYNS20]